MGSNDVYGECERWYDDWVEDEKTGDRAGKRSGALDGITSSDDIEMKRVKAAAGCRY